MTRRAPLDMAVVHVGRAMSSLERSGASESSTAFRHAAGMLAKASDALIDAIEAQGVSDDVIDRTIVQPYLAHRALVDLVAEDPEQRSADIDHREGLS